MFSSPFHFLYPPKCLVCDVEIQFPYPKHPLSHNLCSSCRPPALSHDQKTACRGILCDACGETVPFIDTTTKHCLLCLLLPLPLTKVRSLLSYQESFELEHIIKKLKYGKQIQLAQYLGEIVGKSIQKQRIFGDAPFNIIVPLPSASSVLRHRGFSHTTLIAKKLGSLLCLPVDTRALSSQGERELQTHMKRKERIQNVQGKFVSSSKQVLGKRVLLVDDVMTTGASLCAAAKALREAHATQVFGITLLRSQVFQKSRFQLAKSFG